MRDTVNPFNRIRSLGYNHLIPITPPGCKLSERSSLYRRLTAKKPRDDRGKAPGIRGRDGDWFSLTGWSKPMEIQAEEWHAMGAGVGMKLGPVLEDETKHLIALDADTYNVEHAKTVKAIIDKWLKDKAPIRIGQYPKALYLMRTDPGLSTTPLVFGAVDENGQQPNRIEVLAEGAQFVADGIHSKTGKPYEWKRPLLPAGELPYISAEDFQSMLAEIMAALPDAKPVEQISAGNTSPVSPEHRQAPEHLVKAALDAMPNTVEHFPTRKHYTDMMYYIRGAMPYDEHKAFEFFEDWALEYPDNTPDVVRDDWRRMKNEPRSGFPQLLEKLRELGHADKEQELRAMRFFDQAAATEAEKQAPASSEKSPNAFEEIQKKAAKFVFEPFYDAASTALTAAAKPLIKGLLDQGAMSVVYGQSNVGKTFLTVDIGYHIATGLSYAGMKTTRGHVIYLSAEGGRSITKRLSALCMKYGTTADVDFHLLRSSIDLRRPDADLLPLIVAIKGLGVPVSLIVVDTLSRALAGGDENSSVDMGQIVTNFDKLREHTNAHLMVVHHSGKNQAAGARGHSLLRAATDTEIEVSEGVIAAKKQRDLDKNWSSSFTLDVHTLGVDEDGDPVTSCSVRLISHAEATAVQVEALTPSEAIVAAAVAELDAFNEDENEGVGAAELIDFLAGRLEDISQNSVRQLLKRGVQKGALTKCRRGRWKSAVLQSGQESGQSVFS